MAYLEKIAPAIDTLAPPVRDCGSSSRKQASSQPHAQYVGQYVVAREVGNEQVMICCIFDTRARLTSRVLIAQHKRSCRKLSIGMRSLFPVEAESTIFRARAADRQTVLSGGHSLVVSCSFSAVRLSPVATVDSSFVERCAAFQIRNAKHFIKTRCLAEDPCVVPE